MRGSIVAITLTQLQGGVIRSGQLLLGIGGLTPSDLHLQLYVNNHAPAYADGTGAFTICTAPGYADVDLAAASWVHSTVGSTEQWVYPNITFTFTGSGGGQVIYGVLLISTAGDAVAAALLDTPFTIPAGGGQIILSNLTWQQKQCS